MVNVFKIRKGDTIKFRNGEVHTITKVANISVSKGRKSITICIERCGKEDCYTYEITGGLWWPDCRTESSWDIVEHIPRKENNMIYVNDFKVGDKVVLRDGAKATVEKISEYKKGFGLELSCFPGRELGCYANGWQKNFEQSKYDIVEHIPNQGEEYEPAVEWKHRWVHNDEEPAQDEMTMRDQFAMAAMNGILIGDENWHSTCLKELSELSYSLADAMMKTRKENN